MKTLSEFLKMHRKEVNHTQKEFAEIRRGLNHSSKNRTGYDHFKFEQGEYRVADLWPYPETCNAFKRRATESE